MKNNPYTVWKYQITQQTQYKATDIKRWGSSRKTDGCENLTLKSWKLATIEITRGDTLISVIKGFLLGGAANTKVVTSANSHRYFLTDTQTPETYTLHICPQTYIVWWEKGKKSMGILWMTIILKKRTQMNKDKTGRQLHWGNNMTCIVTLSTSSLSLTWAIVPVQRRHVIGAGEVQRGSCDFHHVLIAGSALQAVEALAAIACVVHISSRLWRTWKCPLTWAIRDSIWVKAWQDPPNY